MLPTVSPVTYENYEDYLDFEEFKVVQGNIIKKTDSYNLSHQSLKVNTDWEVSHIYNRKRGMILHGFNKLVCDLLSETVTEEQVKAAHAHAIRNNLPFPYGVWMRVVTECGGRIPIKVEAVPDGRWCPKGTPFAQVRNTVEGFGELVTWFEPIFLRMAFPSGTATRAFHMRKYLEKKMKEQEAPELFLWRFHSFGYRGHNSEEDAFWAGTSWNMFLFGTDDFHTSWFCRRNTQGSIRALAHKVTQQFNGLSRDEAHRRYGVTKALKGDVVAMYNAIDQASYDPIPENRVVALVIDTYDAFRVINNNIVDLAAYAQDKGVHIVFRPDSGDVLEQAIMIYWKLKNEGLETAAHCIIGEGMSFERAQEYDERLEREGIPLMFVWYGIGAGFYKDIDRDWVGAAMKTAFSNGEDRMKLVLTAPEKSSIPGKVQLVNIGGVMTIVPEEEAEANGWRSEYRTVYEYENDEGDPFIRINRQSWGEIADTASWQTGEQGRIAVSRSILDKIEGFKAMIMEDEAV